MYRISVILGMILFPVLAGAVAPSSGGHSHLRAIPEEDVLPYAYPAHRSAADNLPDEVPLMVVPVSFGDRVVTSSSESWESYFFAAENSVSAYYDWVSDGRFSFTSAGVYPLTLTQLHPDSGDDFVAGKALARKVFTALNAVTDIGRFDKNSDGLVSPAELAVVIVVAGYENAYGGEDASHPRIWAHKSTTTAQTGDGVYFGSYVMMGEYHGFHRATIGIACHELAHLLFGLPDLYDLDGSSKGIGDWGLMGYGLWNSGGGYQGQAPAAMLAWSRERAGFAESLSLEDVDLSSFSLAPGEFLALPLNQDETIYLEQRSRSSFDEGLSGEGILVTHVDLSRNGNDDEDHKMVDVEEADGRTDLDTAVNEGDDGDVFPGSSHNYSFSAYSAPEARTNSGVDTGLVIYFSGTGRMSLEAPVQEEESSSGSFSFCFMVCFSVLLCRKRRPTHADPDLPLSSAASCADWPGCSDQSAAIAASECSSGTGLSASGH